MGNGRARRLTTIVAVLTCALVTLAPFPASAAAALRVSPQTPSPGSSLSVEGDGFPAGVPVDIYLDLEHVAIAVPDGKDGSFTDITVPVPDSAFPGRHFVTAISRRDDVTAQVSFIVRSDWPQFHRTADHRAHNSRENILNSSNVANLEILWRGKTNDDIVSSPAIVDGVVYVGSVDGKLYAFREGGCGDHECAPLWQGLTDGRILASPAVSRGTVFVTAQQKLYAFDAGGCGGSVCSPTWTADVGPISISPTVAGGSVYVLTSNGTLAAFPVEGCDDSTCSPSWRTLALGASDFSVPAVADGMVYSVSGLRLRAFRASGCAFQPCEPDWFSDHLGQVSSSPAVSGGHVFATTMALIAPFARALSAFPAAGCGGATCTAQWSMTFGAEPLAPSAAAIGNGLVHITTSSTLWTTDASGCFGATCPPLWRHPLLQLLLPASSPAIAADVVYVGGNNRLYAFPQSCVTCVPIRSIATGGQISSSPAVVNGRVFVGSQDNYLYAIGLPDDPPVLARPDPAELMRPSG